MKVVAWQWFESNESAKLRAMRASHLHALTIIDTCLTDH